jgi:hypothetical protein
MRRQRGRQDKHRTGKDEGRRSNEQTKGYVEESMSRQKEQTGQATKRERGRQDMQ